MYYASLMTYVVIVGSLAPTLVNLYLRYAREPTAPYLLQIYHYRIPFMGIGAILILGLIVVVLLGIREYHHKQNRIGGSTASKSELEALKERINSIERKIL